MYKITYTSKQPHVDTIKIINISANQHIKQNNNKTHPSPELNCNYLPSANACVIGETISGCSLISNQVLQSGKTQATPSLGNDQPAICSL